MQNDTDCKYRCSCSGHFVMLKSNSSRKSENEDRKNENKTHFSETTNERRKKNRSEERENRHWCCECVLCPRVHLSFSSCRTSLANDSNRFRFVSLAQWICLLFFAILFLFGLNRVFYNDRFCACIWITQKNDGRTDAAAVGVERRAIWNWPVAK